MTKKQLAALGPTVPESVIVTYLKDTVSAKSWTLSYKRIHTTIKKKSETQILTFILIDQVRSRIKPMFKKKSETQILAFI